MKRDFIYLLLIATISIAGCGGSSSTSSKSTTTNSVENKSISSNKQNKSKYFIAKDNLLKNVTKSFQNYQIKVLTDKSLDEDAVSKDTFIVYGKVDGKNTASLLKLNSNYPIGTKIKVELYSSTNSKLLRESNLLIYSGNNVNFGNISTRKGD